MYIFFSIFNKTKQTLFNSNRYTMNKNLTKIQTSIKLVILINIQAKHRLYLRQKYNHY